MSIPKYDEMYKQFLTVLADGSEYNTEEVRTKMKAIIKLSDDELNELIPSGVQPVFFNRVGWTMSYLKMAGLIKSPKRGIYKITDSGLSLLKSGRKIDNDVLMEYESFRNFIDNKTKSKKNKKSEEHTFIKQTPLEAIDDAMNILNKNLAEKLLVEIMNQTPDFFERLVVSLLLKMGYGADEYAGYKTKSSGDEGIDGVITEDKLGFSKIYIQAKRWEPQSTVGGPEIHKFIGAMVTHGADKGLFITTARFSSAATEYAKKHLASKIVLVDGNKLTDLMIEYNLGVTTRLEYSIKDLDIDFFTEELD